MLSGITLRSIMGINVALEPPSSPQIPGLETDLPSRERQTDLEEFL